MKKTCVLTDPATCSLIDRISSALSQWAGGTQHCSKTFTPSSVGLESASDNKCRSLVLAIPMSTQKSLWGQIAYSLKVSKKQMNKTITKASNKLTTYNFKQAKGKEWHL